MYRLSWTDLFLQVVLHLDTIRVFFVCVPIVDEENNFDIVDFFFFQGPGGLCAKNYIMQCEAVLPLSKINSIRGLCSMARIQTVIRNGQDLWVHNDFSKKIGKKKFITKNIFNLHIYFQRKLRFDENLEYFRME